MPITIRETMENKVYVSGVNQLSEGEIEVMCRKYGEVVTFQMHTKSKGFVFVSYKNLSSCHEFIDKMNNTPVKGGRIRLEMSVAARSNSTPGRRPINTRNSPPRDFRDRHPPPASSIPPSQWGDSHRDRVDRGRDFERESNRDRVHPPPPPPPIQNHLRKGPGHAGLVDGFNRERPGPRSRRSPSPVQRPRRSQSPGPRPRRSPPASLSHRDRFRPPQYDRRSPEGRRQPFPPANGPPLHGPALPPRWDNRAHRGPPPPRGSEREQRSNEFRDGPKRGNRPPTDRPAEFGRERDFDRDRSVPQKHFSKIDQGRGNRDRVQSRDGPRDGPRDGHRGSPREAHRNMPRQVNRNPPTREAPRDPPRDVNRAGRVGKSDIHRGPAGPKHGRSSRWDGGRGSSRNDGSNGQPVGHKSNRYSPQNRSGWPDPNGNGIETISSSKPPVADKPLKRNLVEGTYAKRKAEDDDSMIKKYRKRPRSPLKTEESTTS